jgi:hypothetical protein
MVYQPIRWESQAGRIFTIKKNGRRKGKRRPFNDAG